MTPGRTAYSLSSSPWYTAAAGMVKQRFDIPQAAVLLAIQTFTSRVHLAGVGPPEVYKERPPGS